MPRAAGAARRNGGSGVFRAACGLLALAACGSGSGVVEGLVFEDQREIAIEGAAVSIRSLEGDGEEQFSLTDINGLYRFEDVREGINEVEVVKEGYQTGSGISVKLADVVENNTLELDFRLPLIPLRRAMTLSLRVLDLGGPLEGAVVDYYLGPCVGRSSGCLREIPDEDEILYSFRGRFLTDEAGVVSVQPPVVEEFNDYILQFRITAFRHQNSVFDVVLNLDSFPDSVDHFLPRL